MELPVCPHCGHKINYVQACAIKSEGEYWCTECGGISNIKLKKPVYTLGFGVIGIGVVTFLVYLIFMSSIHIWFLFLMLLPYLLFEIFCPFFVLLKAVQLMPSSQQNNAQTGAGVRNPSSRPASAQRAPQGVPPRQYPQRTSVRPVQPNPASYPKTTVPPSRQVPLGTYSASRGVPPPTEQNLHQGTNPHIRHL